MPKSTKKRTNVKNLGRPKQELTATAAKRVKGGLLPAVQPSQGSQGSLGGTAQKVKKGGLAGKGGFTLGETGGLQ